MSAAAVASSRRAIPALRSPLLNGDARESQADHLPLQQAEAATRLAGLDREKAGRFCVVLDQQRFVRRQPAVTLAIYIASLTSLTLSTRPTGKAVRRRSGNRRGPAPGQ